MNRKKKIAYGQWISLVIAWILITNFFAWISILNMKIIIHKEEYYSLFEENLIYSYMSSGFQYLEATLFGIFFGSAFFFINFATDRYSLNRRSFITIVITKSILYVFSIIISSIIIFAVFKSFNIIPKEIEMVEYSKYITSEFWIAAIIYYFGFIILLNIFIQIDRKFGPGNFLKIFFGKYHLPHEEDKIFLFIDLNNSTEIAEALGHKKYSQFIRECFHDLTDVVLKYEAEIYQYVGDEIVLCWDKKKGFKELNCIKAFFAYENQLRKRKKYYQSNYNFSPEFKGGMDEGNVTATEIGDIKRDIAYHGDVLNTAARIQEKCKQYQEKLLVSEHIVNQIDLKNGFAGILMGNISLRGKKNKVDLFAIRHS